MSTPVADTREILAMLLGGGVLDEPLAERVFELILAGQTTDAQLGAMLAFIAARGAAVDEIVAGARVLRRHMTPLDVRPVLLAARALGHEPVILDTCGTGGATKLLNVSSIAAFVTAAADPSRVIVAKHGGRSRTGRGSAEVLEQLGVNIDAPPAAQARCLAQAGVCFSCAPHHHPAMRHAVGARKSLGFPTIFNLIGPLCNPAGATHQLVGTFDPVVARSLARALQRLGSLRATVVTSQDGLDELTTTAPNEIIEVTPLDVRESVLDARELGLPRRSIAELQVHSLGDAVQVFRNVLAGSPGPAREIVELNAAAALVTAGAAPDLPGGLALSREAIDSGRANQAFTLMRDLSRT